MLNRLKIISICAFIILYGAGPGVSAEDEAGTPDLRDAEKGIELLQDKFRKREYDIKKHEEYAKVHAAEMTKCGELRSEIWKLKDSAKALAAKLVKLEADRKKADTELAAHNAAYDAREKDVKALESAIAAAGKQSGRLAEAGEKESLERKEKIEKLRTDLKPLTEKIEYLSVDKSKIEDDLKTKDAEYRAETDKLKALKEKLASVPEKPEKKEGAPQAPAKDGSTEEEIKKNMDELMAVAQKWETARQRLSEEILAVTGEKRSREEEIKALENEDAQKAKDLKARAEDLDKKNKEARAKIEKLKKKALSAKFKARASEAAVKKLEDDIKAATEEKHLAEKTLKSKVDELKVRISVLLDQDDAGGLLKESYKKKPAKAGAASKGEELSVKLDRIFETMKNENDRLAAENKTMQARLERAEKTAAAAKRKAEEAAMAPKELRVKLNKERLDTHFNLAVVYEKNGMWHDAEREYLKCLRIDPKDPGVHYNLGILYDDKLNRNNKAMHHYYKFLSLRPMGDTAERVRDWITKLELENRLGKEMR